MTSVRVSEDELRRLFNEAGILEQVAKGELLALCVKDNEVDKPFLPKGSRSQLIHYVTPKLLKMASAHQYLKPDGTLGASGMPDPKFLRIDQTVYYLAAPGTS